jgi:uncharacterized caspase-like protein
MGRYALVIGNSEYQDLKFAQLVTPSEDVNDLVAVLQSREIGGFDEVESFINRSVLEVRRAVARHFASKKPDDLLVLYFSGHGVRDDRGLLYLAVRDTEYDLLNATAMPASYITEEMDRSRSRRQVLVLDCCHSGAFAQGAKGTAQEAVGTGTAFEGTGFGRTVLTATDATQFAWEGDRLIGQAENSVFTHYLVEGLRTGAADRDSDGRITLDELYDYLYAQVVQATPKQTPRKFTYNQQGDVVIALNPRPTALEPELRQALESPFGGLREGAVRELERLARGSQPGLAQAALEALNQLARDDSQRVSQAAQAVLAALVQGQPAPASGEAAALASSSPTLAPTAADTPSVPAQVVAGPVEPPQAEPPAWVTDSVTASPKTITATLPIPSVGRRPRRVAWAGLFGTVVVIGLLSALGVWLARGYGAAPLATEPIGAGVPSTAEVGVPVTGATATSAPTTAPTQVEAEPLQTPPPTQVEPTPFPGLVNEYVPVVSDYVEGLSAAHAIVMSDQENDDWWYYASSQPERVDDFTLILPGSDDWFTGLVRQTPLQDNMGVAVIFSIRGASPFGADCELGLSEEYDQITAYLLLCAQTFRAIGARFGISGYENETPLVADPPISLVREQDREYGLLIARGTGNAVLMVLWRVENPDERVTFSLQGHTIQPNYFYAKPSPGVTLTVRNFVELEFDLLK